VWPAGKTLGGKDVSGKLKTIGRGYYPYCTECGKKAVLAGKLIKRDYKKPRCREAANQAMTKWRARLRGIIERELSSAGKATCTSCGEVEGVLLECDHVTRRTAARFCVTVVGWIAKCAQTAR